MKKRKPNVDVPGPKGPIDVSIIDRALAAYNPETIDPDWYCNYKPIPFASQTQKATPEPIKRPKLTASPLYPKTSKTFPSNVVEAYGGYVTPFYTYLYNFPASFAIYGIEVHWAANYIQCTSDPFSTTLTLTATKGRSAGIPFTLTFPSQITSSRHFPNYNAATFMRQVILGCTGHVPDARRYKVVCHFLDGCPAHLHPSNFAVFIIPTASWSKKCQGAIYSYLHLYRRSPRGSSFQKLLPSNVDWAMFYSIQHHIDSTFLAACLPTATPAFNFIDSINGICVSSVQRACIRYLLCPFLFPPATRSLASSGSGVVRGLLRPSGDGIGVVSLKTACLLFDFMVNN